MGISFVLTAIKLQIAIYRLLLVIARIAFISIFNVFMIYFTNVVLDLSSEGHWGGFCRCGSVRGSTDHSTRELPKNIYFIIFLKFGKLILKIKFIAVPRQIFFFTDYSRTGIFREMLTTCFPQNFTGYIGQKYDQNFYNWFLENQNFGYLSYDSYTQNLISGNKF